MSSLLWKRMSNFVAIIAATPILCLIGLLLSVFSCVALFHKIRTDNAQSRSVRAPNHHLEKNIYKFMFVNSFFNAAASTLFAFKLLFYCLNFTGIFCSSIRETISSQFAYIAVVEFLRSVFKLGSNLSLILVSLSRYRTFDDSTFVFIRRLTVLKVRFQWKCSFKNLMYFRKCNYNPQGYHARIELTSKTRN